jgi:hypothetical protein
MKKQPAIPIMYRKMQVLIANESDGQRTIHLDDLCSNVSIKFRLNRKEARQIIEEMDAVFGFGIGKKRKFKMI